MSIMHEKAKHIIYNVDEVIIMGKYDEAIKKLNPLQFQVTQKKGTEPAFNNPYHDEKREGIYVDIVSKEVLFSSKDKFDSGSGWPSFTQPVNLDLIERKMDFSHGMIRVEISSKDAKTHLGHVFNDGPEGMPRYCINSASLEFIPKEEMAKRGYASYLDLFN